MASSPYVLAQYNGPIFCCSFACLFFVVLYVLKEQLKLKMITSVVISPFYPLTGIYM